MPFPTLIKLSERGIIPRKLAKEEFPCCAACLFAKMKRKPWRSIGKKYPSIRKLTEDHPGANTSTDQLVSSHPGMIPQTSGKMTRGRYAGETVFVDHYSDFTYIHLMKDFSSQQTVEANNSYERKAAQYGLRIKRYRADNGRFKDNLFMQDIKLCNQGIYFCGVGGHHSNGNAERKIRDVVDSGRTTVLHAQRLWTQVIRLNLWPFSLKSYERVRNFYFLYELGRSPEEKFSMTSKCKYKKIKNEHTLFCPVYVLKAKQQGDIGGVPKWEPRARVGVYLGHSPSHTGDVALVLNL